MRIKMKNATLKYSSFVDEIDETVEELIDKPTIPSMPNNAEKM